MWCLLADLEESLGTMEGVRAAYDTMLDLRIATPRIVLNYAQYLQQHHYFEDSFRAYERGVDQFDFPYSLELWIAYLTQFVNRYGGTTVERTRDLFEQAIERIADMNRFSRDEDPYDRDRDPFDRGHAQRREVKTSSGGRYVRVLPQPQHFGRRAGY